MRIGFIYSEMETLGIQYLSSFLKQNGYTTKLFFDPQLFADTISQSKSLNKVFDYKKQLFKQIEAFKPDFLAFSVLSTNYHWAFKFTKEIKARLNIPIVWGGVHPTLDPESVLKLDCVDYIIAGEAEEALLEFVNKFKNKNSLSKLRNVYTKVNGKIIKNLLRPLINNLDQLPFPDKDIFYDIMPYLKDHYTIVTGRGCPHACTFCCNHSLRKINEQNSGKNNFLRRRSADNVVTELKQAKEKYHIKDVFFEDSTFTYDKKWLKEFAILYHDSINLNCFCWVHPAEIDEEVVGYLRLMNCRAVEMGVESINSEIRAKWLGRNYPNEKIENALKLLKKNKIFCITDNIIGLPEEEIKDLENLVDFYNKLRPEKIYIFELRMFPNTQMHELYHDYQDSFKENNDGLSPFTLSSSQNKMAKKIIVLILAIQFLPKKVINFLLKNKLYKFFPAINLYNLLEITPFFLNLFKREKLWFPIRGTRKRYLFFAKKMIINFIKR
ncbi:MAG: radical SAM protein [Candidatus Omnitrophota bacterium]